jgi:hypothetical protein
MNALRRFASIALALLASQLAHAQAVAPGGNSGPITSSNLPSSALQTTTATATYYVDPTGSNSGACTASGSGACSNLTGALAKLPVRVSNAITINIAAGTYTDNIVMNNVDLNAALTLTGPALANITPSTGAATGTLTTVANNPEAAIMTDSAQSWTTDNLIGHFMVMTSGPANAQVRVIARNTATTITLASPFANSPATTNTYAIQAPAAVFTSATSPTLAFRLTGNTGGAVSGSLITMTGIDVVATGSAGTACIFAFTNQAVTLTNSRCRATAATSTGISHRGGGSVNFNVAAAIGQSNGYQLTTTANTGSANGTAAINPNNAFMYGSSSTGSGFNMQAVSGVIAVNGSSGFTMQTNATGVFYGAFLMNNVLRRTTSGAAFAVFRCMQAGPSGINHAGVGTGNSSYSEAVFDNAYIDGCTTGIDLYRGLGNAVVSIPNAGTLICNNTTTCINVANGARMHVAGVFTVTGVTTDITIDGNNYTRANLLSASPTRLPALAPSLSGSTVWQ